MKKFDLPGFISLWDAVSGAENLFGEKELHTIQVWSRLDSLVQAMNAVLVGIDIFSISSRIAEKLKIDINNFFYKYKILDQNGTISADAFETKQDAWSLYQIKSDIENLKKILLEESKDALIFNTEASGVYDFKRLNSEASLRFHDIHRVIIPKASLDEYDEAGRCYTYGLNTACGFHSLRSLEIMIKHYIKSFGKKTVNLKTWAQYVRAIEGLSNDEKGAEDGDRVSPKVSAMIDRIREIDRNPIMHPEDTLSLEAADSLFSLTWITISEMARDISERKAGKADSKPLEPTT